jgi:tetratricopeptide (TPR) repeat protein
MGPYTRDSARVLDTIYGLRARESFPLTGLPSNVTALVKAAFDVQSVIFRGDVWMDLEQPEKAREIYASGLQLVPTARPTFLSAMAWAEREAGNTDEARRLLREVLALEPNNERAQAMLGEMEAAGD